MRGFSLLLLLGCAGPSEDTKDTLGETDPDDIDTDLPCAAAEAPYDGLDNDCDPTTPDDDLDGDGHPVAVDCDDSDPTRHPDADELWFDDHDADCDGADDPDACDDDPPPSVLPTLAECAWTPLPGPFEPVVEWSLSTFTLQPTLRHVIMTPVVGQLTDDDADGDRDGDDTPDIAFITYNSSGGRSGVLHVVSGADGTEELSVYDVVWEGQTLHPYRYAQVALGDIDRDGEPEIVTVVDDGSVCHGAAFEVDGTPLWVDLVNDLSCRAHAPALADLEGDGDVEVILGRTILRGEDGGLQGAGAGGQGSYSGYVNGGFMSFAADLDGDGAQEVIAGSSVYDAQGATICSTGEPDGYPAVADLDGDGLGELVVVGGGQIRLYEHDCTRIRSWEVYGGGYGGPPTIADYNGDGAPEIGLPGDDYYSVYTFEGTRLWAKAIDDSTSHSTGSAVFDFNGDGRAEVVYGDQSSLWVFDGATGDVLQDAPHTSGTVNEYPIVADVDGDGNAEIVVGNEGSSTGITVFGDARDNWVSARTVWNQHAYSITHIADDLSVPASPLPNWPTYNSFRQGAPGSLNPIAAPDAVLRTYAACQSSCGDPVTLYVQAANEGHVRLPSTVHLDLYGEDDQGARTLLTRDTIGYNLDPGDLSAPRIFVLDAAAALAWTRLVVVVDPDDEAHECDEQDNEATIDVGGVCP